MKPTTKLYILFFILFFFPFFLLSNTYTPFVVVIDAGHGGDDSGAIGVEGVMEKSTTLEIALKLGSLIEEKYGKAVKVVYTRKTDVFIPLHRRAQIANENNADLFVSIHCNSAKSEAMGTETFVLGLHREEDNLAVAKRENSVIFLEENYQTKYEGFNPNDPAAYIGFMLTVGEHQKQSIRFAKLVEDSFVNSNRQSRGVKQAGFLVIRETAMPSVLIETGFITNKEEGTYLGSRNGREETANAIFKAFSSYKKEYDEKNESQSEKLNVPRSKEQDIDLESKPINSQPNENGSFYKIQILVSKYYHKTTSPNLKGLKNIEISKEGEIYKYYYGKTTTRAEADALLQKLKSNGFPDAFVVEQKNLSTSTIASSTKNYYTIQLFLSKRNIDTKDRKFKGLSNVRKEKRGNFYFYYYGMEENYDNAVILRNKIKALGFEDAFIQKKP